MYIDFAELSANRVYHTMIQTLIPRPVAWILSDNGDGGYNLAPFSFFMGVSSRPPLLAFSVGHKPDGAKKDTWVNIEEREAFVLHIAHRELAETVTASAATLPHGESEVQALSLATVPFEGFCLPRLEAPRIALACRRYEILPIGEAPQGLILGRIERIYVDDAVAEQAGGRVRVNAQAVDPIGRLGGSDYALLGEVVTVPRPA